MMLVPLVLSLTVHEWAHAWSAFKLGDDTAERMGRLTLNPIAHIDPIGTLLLPLMGIPFGWAKPVPVNPVRFTRRISMRTGMVLTAAAGPISNVILAVLAAVVMGLLLRFRHSLLVGPLEGTTGTVGYTGLAIFLRIAIQMNVALALFNLLPFPPLDGSRVVDGLMPQRFRPQWEVFLKYGAFGLLFVVLAGSYILAAPFGIAASFLMHLVEVVAGAG
ncbi:MAG: site-2 protease family protein [Deltaproteobacteria bacterium]|nr:site-2 protease family protein [Deltaproteobacteria bacterium]